MGSLTVVTGMPGTRIRRSLAKFANFADANHGRSVKVFSLEAILQEKAQPLVTQHFPVRAVTVVQTFLLPRPELRRIWLEAWNQVLTEVDEALKESDVLLTFHLAYFHQLTREYFVAADMSSLLSAFPGRCARIVTLIDDIYDCHQALMAGGSASGMMDAPGSMERTILDLMQVLDWRSIEVMLSESLAASLRISHFIFAVKHPMQTLYDLLFSEKKVVYFSHPISEPRRSHTTGHEQEAAAFVEQMAQIVARLQARSTVVEPTTIDELRFSGEGGNLSARWPFHADARELLYEPSEPCPPSARPYIFPAGWSPDSRAAIAADGLVQSLRDAIQEQIDARDHGLVEQSSIIACYRPIYEGNASRGVKEELQHYGRLVALNLRTAEASIVFSPSEDRARYPRRRLAQEIIPGWARRGFLEGSEDGIRELGRRVLDEDSDQMRAFLEGDQDAFQRIMAACELSIRPDESVLPRGLLGATVATRRQAAAAELAAQIMPSVSLYLDDLSNLGVIRLVETEQMFYATLEE
jgi:hypothetical protein